MREHRSFRLTSLSGLPPTAGDATSPIRISSESTFYYKRVFPILWFGFTALFLCMGLGTGIAQKKPVGEFVPFILAPLLLAVFGFGFMKWIVFDLVDEVWDAGSHLIVKNKGKEERIALKDVINVNYIGLMNPPRVTLLLREPSEFGTEISFTPPFRFIHFSMPAIATDLIERINVTRSQSQE
jgi:hypothetical protein